MIDGKTVSQVLEKQQIFDLVVWLPEVARNNLDTIRNLLIDAPNNQKISLALVAFTECYASKSLYCYISR